MNQTKKHIVAGFQKKNLAKRPALVFCAMMLCFALYAQRVTPFQTGSYIPLLTSLRDFAPAPTGMYLINYNYWVSPKGYYDQNGDKLSGVNIELPEEIPDFGGNMIDLHPEAKAFMGMFALYYSSPIIEELGNAKYSFLLGPSFQMVRYKLDARVGQDTLQYQGGISGYGDFFLQPLGFSWSFGDWMDLSVFWGLYLPTASYQTGAVDNLGVGHITHQFQTPALFYLNEQSTAFLITPTLEVSGWFIDRDVKPGERLSLEYGVSQYFTDWLELEIMNAHNWQISPDKGADAWWLGTSLDSFDRKNLVSVGANVWGWAERLQLRFKFWDYGAVQNMANNYFSFSLLFNPHWLNYIKAKKAEMEE